jgi:type VI secretion system lysozyme-like protein
MESRHQRHQLNSEPGHRRRLQLPLFERLVPSECGEPRGVPFHREVGIAEAIESVRRELMRLWNTRTRPDSELGDFPLTTIDYGLPDFASASPQGATDRARLVASIVRRIEAFEPRLRNVRLTLHPNPRTQSGLVGTIEADIVVGYVADRVSFEIDDTPAGALIEIAAAK